MNMEPVFFLDRIVLRPGKLRAFRDKLAGEYVPAAHARGLRLVDAWLTPPLELHDDGNELVLLWSLADVGAFWEMRRLQGEDPEGARWWDGLDEWVVSRSRQVLKRDGLVAPEAAGSANPA